MAEPVVAAAPLFQAVLLGSAVLVPFAEFRHRQIQNSGLMFVIDFSDWDVQVLMWIVAMSSIIHLLMIWGEVSLTHPLPFAARRLGNGKRTL